jgi:NADPH:quinone reductase-like Zn-dependent oxidoreductase
MKAIAQDVYGPADVLELRDVAQPTPGAGQILVHVRAAGVDPGVWILMTGTPYAARLAFGVRKPKVAVRGRAFAGVVAAVGDGVTGFQPGDEVYGTTPTGSYAEYAVAPVKWVARKPASLTFEQAAAVPISAVTALQAVRDGARVREGQRVLVIGAAGGVGSFAVQLAAAYGATVTGVCGPGKAELVRSLGATDVIDYTRAEVDRDGQRYDVIIDTAGNRKVRVLRRALTPGGTIVLVGGGHATHRVLGGMHRQLGAPMAALFRKARVTGLMGRERAADLDALTELIDAGKVTPTIDRTYPLPEAADAIRYLAGGHPAGKVVVSI